MQARQEIEVLPVFVKFLLEHGLVDPERLELLDRLNFQKYAFLARKFGLDIGYEFSIYISGPYSSDLADTYYKFTKNLEHITTSTGSLPASFDQKGYLALVDKRDYAWLEIAATLVDYHPRYTDEEKLIYQVDGMKSNHTEDFIRGVLRDLYDFGMLQPINHT